MIPLVIATIVTIIIGRCNLDPLSRGIILFLVFTLTTWASNYITLKFLKTEITILRLKVPSEHIKTNILYTSIHSEKFKNENVIYRQRHSASTLQLVLIPAERLKIPRKQWLFLTLPRFWFYKINRWKYKPHLGKVTIYYTYNQKR